MSDLKDSQTTAQSTSPLGAPQEQQPASPPKTFMGIDVKMIAKFAFTSLTATALDLGLFWLIVYVMSERMPEEVLMSKHIPEAYIVWTATTVARVISATYNYIVNKRLVFNNQESDIWMPVKFGVFSLLLMMASAFFTTLVVLNVSIDETVAKVIVDTCLFFISYKVQKKYIF